VNDADRLGRDPAMRWIVGGRAVTDHAASMSQIARFETSAMTSPTNLTALATKPLPEQGEERTKIGDRALRVSLPGKGFCLT